MSDKFEFNIKFDHRGIIYGFSGFELVARPKDDDRWVVEVLRDGSCLGVDAIDLSSATSRGRLVKALVGVSDEERDLVAKALMGLAGRIAADYAVGRAEHERRRQEARAQADAAQLLQELAELEPEVAPLATDPALLYRAAQTIRALGVAGEEANVPLLYLVLTSRRLPAPISCVVKGESGGGKNNLVAKAVSLFPDDAYYDVTGMSERALVYDPEPVSHRTVIVYETHGSEAGQYFIRSLQSEGRIRYKTVIDMTTVTIEKEGPTNFITTTTQPEVHPENETRQWSLFVDESEETTRQAKRVAAREAAGSLNPPDSEPWRKLQRWLSLRPAPTVVIPYAEFLVETTPDKPLRIRRDFRRLLAAIETVTFLHLAQRETDGKGRLLASVCDYGMARPLVASLMLQAQAGLNLKTRMLVEVVSRIYDSKAGESERSVSYKELMETTELSKPQISKWIAPAIDEGFVENLEAQRGKVARLVPGLPLRDGAGLPTVETLAAAFPDLAIGSYIDPITGEERYLSPLDPENTGNGGNTPSAEAEIVSENDPSDRFRSNRNGEQHPDLDDLVTEGVADRFQLSDNGYSDREPDTETATVNTVAGVFAGGEEEGHFGDLAKRLMALGEELGFPTIPSAIGSGRPTWENASRFCLGRDIEDIIKKAEAWRVVA